MHLFMLAHVNHKPKNMPIAKPTGRATPSATNFGASIRGLGMANHQTLTIESSGNQITKAERGTKTE